MIFMFVGDVESAMKRAIDEAGQAGQGGEKKKVQVVGLGQISGYEALGVQLRPWRS